MRKNILILKNSGAKTFLLRSESYFNGDLPLYFDFTSMLRNIDTLLRNNVYTTKNARDYSDVNYSLYMNKDGKYAWRNLQFINPVLYVDLVNKITQYNNWQIIINRFKQLQHTEIICASMPVLFSKYRKNKPEQILEWWEEVEQQSLCEALNFSYIHTTDISDCYPSIYTHSIAWALHGKNVAKQKRQDKSLLGNLIDNSISNMQYGQTNGIPQGSILMDLIAELVLAYADDLLYLALKPYNLDYKIIRYRDDYKIFTKTEYEGKIIIKELSTILLSLNLKLNPQKTTASKNIINETIKKDKLYKICHGITNETDSIQHQLLQVYNFCEQFRNSNQAKRFLLSINRKIEEEINRIKSVNMITKKLIIFASIVVEIAYKNPVLYPQCAQLLSTIFHSLDFKKQLEIITKIRNKFIDIPYHSNLEIWLQRINLSFYMTNSIKNEQICDYVIAIKNNAPLPKLWNFDWLGSNKKLISAVEQLKFVDVNSLNTISNIIEDIEVDIFSY